MNKEILTGLAFGLELADGLLLWEEFCWLPYPDEDCEDDSCSWDFVMFLLLCDEGACCVGGAFGLVVLFSVALGLVGGGAAGLRLSPDLKKIMKKN